jgi:hypothetical protein
MLLAIGSRAELEISPPIRLGLTASAFAANLRNGRIFIALFENTGRLGIRTVRWPYLYPPNAPENSKHRLFLGDEAEAVDHPCNSADCTRGQAALSVSIVGDWKIRSSTLRR